MKDEMPSTYTTTTTTTRRSVFFDKGMLRRREVILKIAEMVLCLIGIICVSCTRNRHSSPAGFYYFAAVVGLVVAIVLFVLYMTHIRDKIAPTLRLNFVEMVYSAVWCIFFVGGSIAAILYGNKYYGEEAMLAAGAFGLVLSLVYFLEAYHMHRAWKMGATTTATMTTTTQQVA